MHVKFRYTLGVAEEDAKILSWIKEISPGHLVIKHPADEEVSQDHWHARLTVDMTDQGLRKSFKKFDIPKARFSFGNLPDSTALSSYERYMCHGSCKGDRVIVISAVGLHYNEDWFVEQNEAFWSARAEFKKDVKERKNKLSTIDEIVAICKQKERENVDQVADTVIDYFRDTKRVIQEHYIKGVMLSVCIQLGISHVRANLKMKLYRP